MLARLTAKLPSQIIHFKQEEYAFRALYSQCQTNPIIPPIIIINGIGQGIKDMKLFTSYFLQYTDVIAVEDVTVVPYPIDFQPNINSIHQVLTSLNIEKANFAGISFGAYMSYGFACQYPSMVSSMMLTGIGTKFTDCFPKNAAVVTSLVGDMLKHGNNHKEVGYWSAKALTDDERLVPILARVFSKLFKDGMWTEHFVHYLQRVMEYGPRFCQSATGSVGDIPVMLAAASNDIIIDFEESKSFGNNLKNCTLFEVHDCHMWGLKHERTVTDICHDFFLTQDTKKQYLSKNDNIILSRLDINDLSTNV